MRPMLVRRYPVLVVGAFFVLFRILFPDFRDTRDYIISYALFLFFARPLLLDRSIFEMLERFLPKSIREKAVARRQKRRARGPFGFYRIMSAIILLAVPPVVLAFPIRDNLVEAVSLHREQLGDDSIVDALLSRVSVLLSFAVFFLLLLCNLFKRYFLDLNTSARNESSTELPGCWHAVVSLFAVFLSVVLLMASYLSQFTSENIGYRIMLVIQLIIWVMLLPGERLLRKRS